MQGLILSIGQILSPQMRASDAGNEGSKILPGVGLNTCGCPSTEAEAEDMKACLPHLQCHGAVPLLSACQNVLLVIHWFQIRWRRSVIHDG